MPLDSARNNGIPNQPPRWHLIYYVLAGFDLLTIMGTLFLSFATLTLYTNSVDENNHWAKRAGIISDLSLALVSVDSPGNDVFESHNPEHEQQRLANYHTQFIDLYTKISADLSNIKDQSLQQSLTTYLNTTQQFENAMVNEANSIFQYYRNGDTANAGKHMATMDKYFASASHSLSNVNQLIRKQQTDILNADIQKAKALSHYEYYIFGFILMMVMGIVFYGRFLSKKMKAADTQIKSLLAHNKGIVDTCREGIITTNAEGVITSINPSGAQMFEYAEQELIGQNIERLFSPQDERTIQDILLSAVADNMDFNQLLTFFGLKKSGAPFNMTASSGKLLLNSDTKTTSTELFFVITLRDISQQKQLENQLIEAKTKAEAANTAKSYFLANMSHEIRTPMTGVIGMLDLIAMGELSTKQRHFASLAQSSAKALLVIINDILDFSKIEAGKFT